jgi:hypothetical protein
MENKKYLKPPTREVPQHNGYKNGKIFNYYGGFSMFDYRRVHVKKCKNHAG